MGAPRTQRRRGSARGGEINLYFDLRGDESFFPDFAFSASGATKGHEMQTIPLPFQTSLQEHFGQAVRGVVIARYSSTGPGELPNEKYLPSSQLILELA